MNAQPSGILTQSPGGFLLNRSFRVRVHVVIVERGIVVVGIPDHVSSDLVRIC